MGTLTPEDVQDKPPADNLFDLINMWWHRVGFDATKLPPYSEACLRCGGTTKLLYTGATCPNCEGTGLRPAVRLARLSSDGEARTPVKGPVAEHATLQIGRRTAQLAIPSGWQQRSSAEIAELQAVEGDGSTVIAQLYPQARTPDVVYAVTISTVTAPADSLTLKNMLELVQIVERDMSLRAVSQVENVDFGGDVGWLWHLQGRMPGRLLSRPDQAVIPVHCAEVWAPVDSGTVLKVLLTAPPEQEQEATAALNTMISSWRWDPPIR